MWTSIRHVGPNVNQSKHENDREMQVGGSKEYTNYKSSHDIVRAAGELYFTYVSILSSS